MNHQKSNTVISVRQVQQNTNQVSRQWAFEKLKLSQSLFVRGQIKNQILKQFPAAALEMLLTAGEQINLESQKTLCRAEEPLRFVYFPETAVVSEYRLLEDGKTTEISMTGMEGMIGIPAIFSPRSLSVNWIQTSLSGSALRVDSNVFQQILDGFPKIRQVIFESVGLYVGQISQRLICGNHHLLEGRLCNWLLMLNDRGGRDSLNVTQEQIARALGVHRPSVTLIMQSLRERKIVDYMRGRILIVNRPQLENWACDCCAAVKKTKSRKKCMTSDRKYLRAGLF